MICEKNWKQSDNLKGYIDYHVAKKVVDPSVMAFSNTVIVGSVCSILW
jgi:hypothetical protein